MKQAMKSKTVRFMLLMATLESIAAGLHYLAPLITMEQINIISFVVGMATSVGGVYLRTITTQPLSEK